MENIVQTVTTVNNAVNGFVWGMPMLIMLVGTGILMTILTRAFLHKDVKPMYSVFPEYQQQEEKEPSEV